jgi:putative two-component system response regulator
MRDYNFETRNAAERAFPSGWLSTGYGGDMRMPATIMLVDPDASNRMDWEVLLRNFGYKVFWVENGKAALAKCGEVQPDLVLIEGPLPDISGVEVSRRLKSDPITQSTPIVLILTGINLSEAARKPDSVDDYWARPASRWEALNRIQALLHLRSYIDQQAESVAFSLARSLDAKDASSAGHSGRVREYSAQLGSRIGLSADELAALRVGSLVHDLGKIAVPDSILFKPGALTAAEMEVVRQHPVVGESICAPLKSFRDVLPIIRHHHERIDGSGYPDGLAGERIPLLARVTQVVDIYDALTTDRSYRRALDSESALGVMSSEASRGWLDRDLVAEFFDICRTAHFPLRREASMITDYQA